MREYAYFGLIIISLTVVGYLVLNVKKKYN